MEVFNKKSEKVNTLKNPRQRLCNKRVASLLVVISPNICLNENWVISRYPHNPMTFLFEVEKTWDNNNVFRLRAFAAVAEAY